MPDAALIMLHGLGSSPERLGDALSLLDLPDGIQFERIFPRAPVLPVTINATAESYTKPAREKQGAWLSLSISRQNIHPVARRGFSGKLVICAI